MAPRNSIPVFSGVQHPLLFVWCQYLWKRVWCPATRIHVHPTNASQLSRAGIQPFLQKPGYAVLLFNTDLSSNNRKTPFKTDLASLSLQSFDVTETHHPFETSL